MARITFLAGLAVGTGAALLGPMLWRGGRPYAKSALRAGISGFAAAKVAAARLSEEVEDLVAEVAHEMNEATPTEQPAGPSDIHAAAQP